MNNLGTIVRFTIKNKMKTKSFVISTLIMVILISIGVNIPYLISLFGGGKDKTVAVGIVDGDKTDIVSMLKDYYDKREQPELQIRIFETTGSPGQDEAMLKEKVADGQIQGYLLWDPNGNGEFPEFVYKTAETNAARVISSLQHALNSIKMEVIVKDLLNESQKAALSAPVVIESEEIASGENGSVPEATDKPSAVDHLLVTFLILLFFITTVMTGNMIASEVTAEKSSRIMEILIASTPPLQHMFGKIIGMFLVGLSQIAVYLLTVAFNLAIPHNAAAFSGLGIHPEETDATTILYGFLFYILGYFLYATLFAAIGSLVSRTEELGQAVTPITILSLGAFYIASFSISTPDTMLVKISSFIPFLSPTSMILRIGTGKTAVWEIWLSIAILAVSILFFGWLSAKIYRTGVLMYGKRPTWKELRKAMKSLHS